jgi:predicted permease
MGIFTGTFQLINNLVSNNVSQITIHQIYSLGYLIVIIVVILIIVSIVRRVARRRKKQKTP